MALTYRRNCTPDAGSSQSVINSKYWNFDKMTQKAGGTENSVSYLVSDSDKYAPCTINYKVNKVKNVYAGPNINPTYWTVNKTGHSAVIQINTCRIGEDLAADGSINDESKTKVLPFEAHLVFKVPDDPAVNASMVKGVINDLGASLMDENGTVSDKCWNMLSGALTYKKLSA